MRTYIRQQFVEAINREFGKPEMIAGVATGGIAHGVLVAQEMGLPFIYVRSATKEHGMKNLVEGDLTQGRNVVVVEDLVSTGQSSLKAVASLREAGCEVKGMASIFTYRLKVAAEAFAEAKVRLFSLTDYNTLLHQAVLDKYINEKDLSSLKKWREDPANWTGTGSSASAKSSNATAGKPGK